MPIKVVDWTPLASPVNEIWERGERPSAGWAERVGYQMMEHVLKSGWTPERAASFYGGISESKMRSMVAIEDERERTFELLTELLVRIQNYVIPEVVAMLPALRGPVGPAGPRQGVDARNGFLRRLRRHLRWRQLSGASRHRRAA